MIRKYVFKTLICVLCALVLIGCTPGNEEDKNAEGPVNKEEPGTDSVDPITPSEDDLGDSVLKIKEEHELADGSVLVFKGDKIGGQTTIVLNSNEEEIIVCDKTPSPPVVSPDKREFAYIDVLQWEAKGDVYLYDVEEGKNERIIGEGDEIKKQYTPKGLAWLDDDKLLVIIGYAYGTTTVGGDLYLYDRHEDKLSLVIDPEGYDEIKTVMVDKDEVTLEFARFNGDMTEDYEIENKSYNKETILGLIQK